MSPYTHAILSAKKFGGPPEAYLEIHSFLDSSKYFLPNQRHRNVLHNNFGIYVCEKAFGKVLHFDGVYVETRNVVIQHIEEDCGRIPQLEECLSETIHKNTNVKFQQYVREANDFYRNLRST